MSTSSAERKPLNTNAEANIYTAISSAKKTVSVTKSQPNHQIKRTSAQNGLSNNLTRSMTQGDISSQQDLPRQTSPRRELWWSKKPSEYKIPPPQPYRPVQTASKIDNKNTTYSPPQPKIAIQSQKLEWKAQPVVQTWENIHYQPGGGNKKYVENPLVFDDVTPRVDTGFVYSYEQ